jgi:outer membrane protein OmpA-like peptidoglycan-associated protein
MSFNLLDSIKGLITPSLISSAATSLGENSGGITKALEGAVPALLSGVINKSTSDSSGIFDLAKKAAGSGVLDNLTGSLSGGNSNLMNMGTSLLSGIFGGKTNMLSSLISSFAGIKPSSGSSLLASLAPIALGVIGKHALSSGMDARGLGNFLSSQKDAVNKAMPSGLSLSSLYADSTPRVPSVPEPPTSGLPKWVLPLLLVVVGAALLFYLFRSCNVPKTDNMATDTTAMVAPSPDTAEVATPPPATGRESLKVELPNGTTLDAYKGGIEDQLVAFLKDDDAKVSKDKWFDFDNLNFNTGTAEITAESQAQINNIAAILKAFPKVIIKIGGYTDKTGDEAGNMKLSKARADAVKKALATAEVGKQVTDAEGYGSEFAKAAADAPESDRVHDRRVSVSVREK